MAEKEYIEREGTYPLAKRICDAVSSGNYYKASFGMQILDWIDDIPAADVRPVRRGTWTDAAITADNLYDTHGMLYKIRGYICNCCREFSLARFNFCPNCGADMRPTSMSGANGEES